MHARPKHILEYALVRILGALLRVLPYRAALGLGWLIARVLHLLGRKRVRIAQQRIRSVFGDRYSPVEARRIAWLSLRNLVFGAVDLIRLPRLTRPWVEEHVPSFRDQVPAVRAVFEEKGGLILSCPHMGAFELAAAIVQLEGMPVFVVAAEQRNRLIDAYINRLRSSTGIEIVLRGSTSVKGILGRLRKGRVLAVLPDVRVRNEGEQVSFLGGTANVGRGAALFSRQLDIPVCPGFITRKGWTRHELHLCEPILPDPSLDKQADIHRITQAMLTAAEDAVRRYPEQWFWYNKRWILDPLDPPAAAAE